MHKEPVELSAIGCLSELSEPERQTLNGYGEMTEYESGVTLIREGKSQNRLYFVVSGVLHASRQGTDRKLLLGRIEEGEWFGEINIFDPHEASATVITAGEAVVWSLSRSQLDAYIAEHPQAGVRLVRGIATLASQRIRRLIDKLDVSQQTLDIQSCL